MTGNIFIFMTGTQTRPGGSESMTEMRPVSYSG